MANSIFTVTGDMPKRARPQVFTCDGMLFLFGDPDSTATIITNKGEVDTDPVELSEALAEPEVFRPVKIVGIEIKYV